MTDHTRAALSAVQAEHRFVLLTATRWFPVGVVFGLTVLLPLERGLSVAEVGVLLSLQGFVVLGLELPTGGLADAIGRRPLLIVSGVLAVGSTALMIVAQGFGMFALALIVQGVFRALDSGPLEAWYVDAAHAAAGPAAETAPPAIERGLARSSTVLGVAIAAGAVVAGLLVAWHPLAPASALVLPFLVAGALYAAHTVLLAALVREPRRAGRAAGAALTAGLRDAPATIIRSLALLGRRPVLRALVLVEVFWSVAMIAFETLTPVQLADTLGGEDAAAALFGPASAAAWGLFALGALLAGRASRRFGVARTAIAARLLNGAFVVLMGLVAGPVGLIAAYWLAYLTHGSAGPMHNTLLHREAGPTNRAAVLSINSMVAGGAYSLGLLALGPLAEATSPAVAFVAAGCFSLFGALLYLPARRSERARGNTIETSKAYNR
ncbi:MFS transporter [Subtercola sp. Z020]|uniref:MFS transporter n=1 Tax=Subtercola sp. Z020 TaxID=2080582 RepID=UPI001E45E814|nr:MFS transporter [Subtercola sp. Z020]